MLPRSGCILHRTADVLALAILAMISLESNTALAQIMVPSPNPISTGKFGNSVCGFADVNGDRIGDFAVGAPGEAASPSPVSAGRAYIISGLNGALIQNLLSPSEVSNGSFGTAVTCISGFNGADRLFIGAPGERALGTGVTAGRVHIFSLSTYALLGTLEMPSPLAGAKFGAALTTVGDITNDGIPDIAVGAPEDRIGTSTTGAGAVYLFDGATSQFIQRLISTFPEISGRFGTSLGWSPNIDGQGHSALLVGAPFENGGTVNDSGRAYVLTLPGGGLRSALVSPAATVNGQFGQSVAGFPDVNGDGRSDFAVGAPNQAFGPTTSAGRAYLYSGATSGVLNNLVSPASVSNGGFGCAILGSAALPGNGTVDVLVGSVREQWPSQSTLVGTATQFSGSNGMARGRFQSLAQSNATPASVSLCILPNEIPTLRGLVLGSNGDSGGRAYIFHALDCNGNGILDYDEIMSGAAADCDGNQVPDECDQNGYFADCNNDGIQDACDLAGGSSLDLNGDGIPDECHFVCLGSLDCNDNGIPDSLELQADDCNANGIPDDCETELPFVVRVSVNAQGEPANGAGSDPETCYDLVGSADGRLVAFCCSADNLVAGDTNGFVDVFVKDRQLGTVENIHVSNTGEPANNSVFSTIAMTPNGRFVAYTSYATNLVPGLDPGFNVFLFDRQTHQTELVTVRVPGSAAGNFGISPSMSDDGRYVAFCGDPTGLVQGVPYFPYQVFRRDRLTGTTILVSKGPTGKYGNGISGALVYAAPSPIYVSSNQVVISENGRYVAFASNAGNLIGGDTNGSRNVFVHDCDQGRTNRITIGHDGSEPNGPSSGTSGTWRYPATLDMTPDGRFIVFDSAASNLVPGDNNNRVDLFIHDRQTSRTARLIIGGTSANPLLAKPTISADGCYVAFVTNLQGLAVGQNLTTSITEFNVFRYEVATGKIDLVSRNAKGVGANATSGAWPGVARISPDGQRVSFQSRADNLDGVTTAPYQQIYVANMYGGRDCNMNGIPDDCDAGFADCNSNGVADACECGCPGDTNGDLRRDGRDVAGFVQCLLGGCSTVGCICADMDADSDVDINDLAAFAAALAGAPGACP